MATKPQRYDAPDFQINRFDSHITTAGTGTYARSALPYARRALRAHLTVNVAGTGANFAATIQSGTASLGVSTLGTAAIGTRQSVTLDTDVAADAVLNAVIAGDATGVVGVTYEYRILTSEDLAD